jgi:hypothetical protein
MTRFSVQASGGYGLTPSSLLFLFLLDYGDDKPVVFDKAVFWSMPEYALNKTEKVWQDTVKLIRADRLEELPSDANTYAVHVRPHDDRTRGQAVPLEC